MTIGPGQATNSFNVVGVALAPSRAGVYALCRANGSYVYFGHADDLRKRLTDHLIDTNSCIHRHGALFFSYELTAPLSLREARRNELLAKYPTPCNPAIAAAG